MKPAKVILENTDPARLWNYAELLSLIEAVQADARAEIEKIAEDRRVWSQSDTQCREYAIRLEKERDALLAEKETWKEQLEAVRKLIPDCEACGGSGV